MEKNRVTNFFNESKDKFATKRQASKYLNEYGSVYKTTKDIPMEYTTRLMTEPTKTPKSHKNVKSKKK